MLLASADFCGEAIIQSWPWSSIFSSTPVSSALADWLLPCLSNVESEQLTDLRHYTIGVLGMQDRRRRRQGNQGAKIAASHLYPTRPEKGLWQMRVWGYVPQHALPDGVTETQIIDDLQQEFSNPTLWQDIFDDDDLDLNAADFRQQRGTDFGAFLRTLVLNP